MTKNLFTDAFWRWTVASWELLMQPAAIRKQTAERTREELICRHEETARQVADARKRGDKRGQHTACDRAKRAATELLQFEVGRNRSKGVTQ